MQVYRKVFSRTSQKIAKFNFFSDFKDSFERGKEFVFLLMCFLLILSPYSFFLTIWARDRTNVTCSREASSRKESLANKLQRQNDTCRDKL